MLFEHGSVLNVGFGVLGSVVFGFKMLNKLDIMFGASVMSFCLTSMSCCVDRLFYTFLI